MAADITNEVKKVHAGTTECTTPRDDALAVAVEALETEIQAVLKSEKKDKRLSVRRHRVDSAFNQVAGYP